jgi:ribonuclease VapC
MVIDSSALVAILLNEPDADALIAAILSADVRLIGAPSYLETATVLVGRYGPPARSTLDRFIAGVATEVVPFSPTLTKVAIDAFVRFGKWRGQAGLKFGDCCSYAIASETRLPLLFKGGDFGATDFRNAVAG